MEELGKWLYGRRRKSVVTRDGEKKNKFMYESIQAHDRGGACGVIETVTWISLSCLSEVVNT